jgi:hypothetical protein
MLMSGGTYVDPNQNHQDHFVCLAPDLGILFKMC